MSAGWLLLLYAVELKSSAGQPVLLYAVELKGLLYAVELKSYAVCRDCRTLYAVEPRSSSGQLGCCVPGLPYAVCRGAEVVIQTAGLLFAAELLLFRGHG